MASYSCAVEQARGFKVNADGGERLQFSDAELIVRASSDSTGGAFTIIEEVEPLDTPLHVHKNEDELWYVLEGEHVVQVGDEEFHVGPGGIAFGPRGVPLAAEGGAADWPFLGDLLSSGVRWVLP